jgi:hypothetical protein
VVTAQESKLVPNYPKGRATRLCSNLYTDFRERAFYALG